MSRRTLLTSAVASLAAPAITLGDERRTIRFMPHADLASLDPVWTTADITRNFSLAVYDTLYGFDADFRPQPQMAEGHAVEDGGRRWRISLRQGLKFHDGSKVLARDCVATIKRFSQRDPFGSALAARLDDISAPSDTVIELRLKSPFALVPDALAQYTCAIMPERLAKTDANTQLTEVMGSGPFRFVAAERVPGSRVVFEKNPDYVPRSDGTPSFTAGPKIVHIDRAVWTFVPDAATSLAAMANNEYDWWEAPSLDLVPSLQKQRDLTVRVLDRSGEIGCLRFNSLHPPFNNQKIRRAILEAVNQSDYIQAIAGGAPEFLRTDVGLFAPGTPMASTVGLDITRGKKSVEQTKAALTAAGYNSEKVVVLAPTTIPSIWGAAQLTQDLLQRVGMNVDFQALEWGTVVQRRASREPVEKGGWSIFHTNLGGMGNVTPAANIAIRGSGATAWFGWPEDARMEALRTAWFDAPDLAQQQKLSAEMQARFWENPSYVPLGMFDQPAAYFSYLQDVRAGWPQFYGVRRA
ncbi:MAG: ABC transporter substrate-binding protein [Acetobacteraceae bacterium]|nr:ABC transporter substrate-binding protein [Acetobacteraceae bacterium]